MMQRFPTAAGQVNAMKRFERITWIREDQGSRGKSGWYKKQY